MKKYKNLIIITSFVFILVLIFGVYQVRMLDRAHSTFENYYAFRGCTRLVSRTEDMGVCELASGEEIKIVKFQGKWYLDGDLPCGFLCF